MPKVPIPGLTWFNHRITVLDWPANSPDLNPIENVWGIVKRKMRETRPNNADELKAAIEATWASLTPQQGQKLINYMPLHTQYFMQKEPQQITECIHNTILFRRPTFPS
jgi:hypothetical protein